MSLIEDNQVSVIVQGPIRYTRQGYNLTQLCVESVRRLLPGAELILSTWSDSELSGIDADEFVMSDDPGPLPRPNHRDSNVNRQITSTCRGLIRAKRPYSLKLRSDCVLYHTGFLGLHQHTRRALGYEVFKEPITATSIYFKNPQKTPYLFHVGDIFHFGLTQDLINLWDIPHVPRAYISEWGSYCKKPIVNFTGGSFFRYIEEQYIWLSCLKKNGYDVDIDYPWHMTEKLLQISECSILGNFVICEIDEIGLCVPWSILSFGINKIYSQEEVERLTLLYGSINDAGIKRRIRQVILNQRIRIPLKYFAYLLNKIGVF